MVNEWQYFGNPVSTIFLRFLKHFKDLHHVLGIFQVLVVSDGSSQVKKDANLVN